MILIFNPFEKTKINIVIGLIDKTIDKILQKPIEFPMVSLIKLSGTRLKD